MPKILATGEVHKSHCNNSNGNLLLEVEELNGRRTCLPNRQDSPTRELCVSRLQGIENSLRSDDKVAL
jgi:hypothetical protein